MKPEQEKKLNEVYQFMRNMQASSSVPFPVASALSARLGGVLAVSTKGADSEDVTVNEAGAATYAVMGDPVGFLQVTINGVIYYIPYFT